MVTKKATPTKTRVRKPVVVPKPPSTMFDRIIDLIKWADSPFKIFTIVLLSFLAFSGYFAWDSRVVILNAITQSSHQTSLKETPNLIPITIQLQKDLQATTVVVHKASLVVNSRTTLLAYGPNGRDNTIDGLQSSLFSKDPIRNAGMIAMLNGEVSCDKLEVLGKSSEWESKQGVTFICRGGIPPEMGEFAGYISVGFKSEPPDVTPIKTRINLASSDMSR